MTEKLIRKEKGIHRGRKQIIFNIKLLIFGGILSLSMPNSIKYPLSDPNVSPFSFCRKMGHNYAIGHQQHQKHIVNMSKK